MLLIDTLYPLWYRETYDKLQNISTIKDKKLSTIVASIQNKAQHVVKAFHLCRWITTIMKAVLNCSIT
jgi:hypothetical protein